MNNVDRFYFNNNNNNNNDVALMMSASTPLYYGMKHIIKKNYYFRVKMFTFHSALHGHSTFKWVLNVQFV